MIQIENDHMFVFIGTSQVWVERHKEMSSSYLVKGRNDVVSDYSFLSDLILVTWRFYKYMC